MKHYLKSDGSVWAFESDGSQDDLIEMDMTPLTAEALFTLQNPPKTVDELRAEAKAARAMAVDDIKVTTQAGRMFDGDEVSQGRMARAIIALQATGTASVTWVLADNTAAQVTAAELVEALALAGAAQAAIWVL